MSVFDGINGEHGYLEMLKFVRDNGLFRGDRTGTGTYSVFGYTYRHDLSRSFPLLTTKKLHIKSIVHELLWFLAGDTNIKYLNDNGVSIWDEWANENGDLGPVYGAQWRKWPDGKGGHIDQVAELIDALRNNPNSRRHIINGWNVAALPVEGASFESNIANGKMALPPCHVLYQFYVSEGKLSCQLYQRSADLFLGVPFNLASVSFLTHMLAQQCDLGVGQIIHTIGDAHIYSNHLDQVAIQLSRAPRELPQLELTKRDSLEDYRFEDFKIVGYDAWPSISAPIAK